MVYFRQKSPTGLRERTLSMKNKTYGLKKYPITALALVLAAALTVVGLTKGQGREVLMKAVYICLECIGVG